MYEDILEYLDKRLKENTRDIGSAITSRGVDDIHRYEGREQMILEIKRFIRKKQGEKCSPLFDYLPKLFGNSSFNSIFPALKPSLKA